MGAALTLLTFERWRVRTLQREGKPWFVLADVCEVLEHSNPSKAAQSLDEDERGLTNGYTLGGQQELLIVSRPGVYKLLATSRKPQARRFDRWVRHEVLEQIAETGNYVGEGKGEAPIARLEELFDAKLKPLHDEQRAQRVEIGKRLEVIQGGLERVEKKVEAAIPPRQDFPKDVTDKWRKTLLTRYFKGLCPICFDARLVHETTKQWTPAKRWHHLYNSNRIGLMDGVPCCVDCHEKLDSKTESHREEVEYFQKRLREVAGPDQGSLF